MSEIRIRYMNQPDMAQQRREAEAPATIGDTLTDIVSAIVIMLAIIAFGLNAIGLFG